MSRANHLSCNRCRGVCIYYKESLPPEVFNIHYLLEFICFYLNIGNKTFNIISFYRSPSETADAFDKCLTNLNLPLKSVTKKKSVLSVVIGGFNARLSKWWINDRTPEEGAKIDNVLS